MTDRLRIALAQLNPHVGALLHNLELGRDAVRRAAASGADVLMFSELFTTGYFPEDLFFKPRFVEDAMEAARQLAAESKNRNLGLLIPTVWREDDGTLRNAVLYAEKGEFSPPASSASCRTTTSSTRSAIFSRGRCPRPS